MNEYGNEHSQFPLQVTLFVLARVCKLVCEQYHIETYNIKDLSSIVRSRPIKKKLMCTLEEQLFIVSCDSRGDPMSIQVSNPRPFFKFSNG